MKHCIEVTVTSDMAKDGPTSHPATMEHPSRRAILRWSAVAASTGLAFGCAPALSRAQAQQEPRHWNLGNMPSQRGHRVLVTGGNGYPEEDRSGLGYQDALALAKAGADVTIASRNRPRGEEAVRRIRQSAPEATIRFETLDLSNMASVASFVDGMRAAGQGLDLLINNAGVMGRPQRELTVDGYERVLATNTIGHFALTAQLMPLLRAGRDPRVVWVCSLRAADSLDFDDLQQEKAYDYAAAYDRSKLANLLLAFEMDRRSKAANWGVKSLAVHPGVARTNLIPNGPGLDSREGRRFRTMPFLFQPAAQGALSTLYAATTPQAVSGAYYGPTGIGGLRGPPGPVEPPVVARDPALATPLWMAMERLGRTRFA